MIHGKLPARLTMEQAAWLLGFTAQDVSVLIAAGLLKPLGHPPKSGSKYLATISLEELRNDTRWLAKASDVVVNHWKEKNMSRAQVNQSAAADPTRAVSHFVSNKNAPRENNRQDTEGP